ncbi:hypothetical protein EI77_01442 [Prosthecobacter fusiformis]|uniref:Uncharacterized protein n=1 Tax=Prosthecobacter fusiformis TaxID=48464 RepID=A0A4R7S5P2_9BACT|nr:hypothetical protein EI77_01442 [Prosthecobacter fusiformis]
MTICIKIVMLCLLQSISLLLWNNWNDISGAVNFLGGYNDVCRFVSGTLSCQVALHPGSATITIFNDLVISSN